MALHELYPEGSVVIGSKAANKQEILAEIADIAASNPVLSGLSNETILAALREREELGSTGFGDEVAIPHCAMDDAEDFACGLVVHSSGIDFDALDGNPSRFFFFIVGPSSERGRHVQLLSAISKFSKIERNIKTLASAGDSEKARGFLIRHLNYLEERARSEASAMMTVFVHDPDYFDDILEILQANTTGSIAISEMHGPGHYLNSLPLFSALWTESESQNVQVIYAVLVKSRCNDVIRRIQMLDDQKAIERSVGIAIQDLFYAQGSIDA